MDAVSVASSGDVWAGFVDLRVDGEGGGVDAFVTLDDVACFVAEDQVGDFDE